MTQRIDVLINNQIRGQKQIDQLAEKYTGLGKRFEGASRSIIANAVKQKQKFKVLEEVAGNFNLTVNEANRAMGRLGFSVNQVGNVVDSAGNSVQNYGTQVRDTARQMKPFRFEMLGVMFAGMAIQRTVSGLLRTSMQWAGIMDITSITMGDLFLPVALDLQTWAIEFMGNIQNLNPEMKKFIGYMALISGAGGIALFAFGQAGLGIQSLRQEFPKTAQKIKNFSKSFGFLKAGGITLSIAWSIKKLKEGEITAAVGAATTGLGVALTGTKYASVAPWAVGIGVALMLLGDEQLQKDLFTLGWKLIDKAIFIGESMSKALTGDFDEIDWGKFKFVTSAEESLSDLSKKGELTSEALKLEGAKTSIRLYKDELAKLREKYDDGKITEDEFLSRSDDINEKYKDIIKTTDTATGKLTDLGREVENTNKKIGEALEFKNLFGALTFPFFGVAGSTIFDEVFSGNRRVGDAIMRPNGEVIETDPNDTLFATKNPESMGGNQVTINVNNPSVRNDSDIKRIADEVKRAFVNDFERLTQRRGST